MISGNIENITAPVRQTKANVEVVNTSTLASSGKAVRLDGCTVGEPLNVKLSSSTITDFSTPRTRPSRNLLDDKNNMGYIKFTTNNGQDRTRFGWIIDVAPGSYAVHIEVVNFENASMNSYVIDANNVAIDEGKTVISYGVPYAGVALTVAENQKIALVLSGTTYTQEAAENLFYNNWNTQVERGTLPTTYEPFGEVEEPYRVLQYGKNLFNNADYEFINYYWHSATGKLTTSSGYSASYPLISVEHLQGKEITLNKSLSTSVAYASGGVVFFSDNAADSFITGVGINPTFTVPAEAKYMGITVPRAYADGTEIQIELGGTITEFEAYREPKSFVANANGVVDGITAYSVNTLCVPGDNDISITASYSVEIAGETYSGEDRVKAITIDRAGENKFFGFGVCQRANVKLLDVERDCPLAAGDKLYIYFNDVKTTAKLRISEIHRDEVTNELSVTAYDALEQAEKHTYQELGLTSYTIGELASAVAAYLSIDVEIPGFSEFSIYYEEGGSFSGNETLRAVLNAIAEVTQTVYYINRFNCLTFKRFDVAGDADYTVDKEQYFTLKNKDNKRLAAISSVTELGNNLISQASFSGSTQYLRNNPLLELRNDTKDILDNALANMSGLTINQFECEWRGNYLLEPCDKVAFITKDDNEVYSYFVNDTITYNGGYSQATSWEFDTEETEHNNPTSLGDIINETYAKVDKANKEITMVASDVSNNSSNIAAIKADTTSINASVSSMEKKLENVDTLNGKVVELTNKVNATMTSEDIKFEIQSELSNGVEKVTTTQGYTFDNEGLKVTSSGNNFSTTITENGMTIKEASKEVLVADNEGVTAVDLHAKTFLKIGKFSRLEDYGSKQRTACFWVG